MVKNNHETNKVPWLSFQDRFGPSMWVTYVILALMNGPSGVVEQISELNKHKGEEYDDVLLHCMECAVYTHMYLSGKRLGEAFFETTLLPWFHSFPSLNCHFSKGDDRAVVRETYDLWSEAHELYLDVKKICAAFGFNPMRRNVKAICYMSWQKIPNVGRVRAPWVEFL